MKVSGLSNNFKTSFHGKSNEKHNAGKSVARLLPLVLLLNTASITPCKNNDTFEREQDSINYSMLNSLTTSDLASNLALNYCDYDIRKALSGKTIVLDPGHGGTSKTQTETSQPLGAKFYDYKAKKWYYEKNLTLDMGKRVEKYLKESGANVIMTRDSDEYVPRVDRAEIAKENNSDMFVSIHVNSSTSTKPSGPSIYKLPSQFKGAKESDELANIMNKKIASAYGIKPEKLWENNFTVLEETKNIPGILVETGYLSNPKDRALLLKDEYRENIAKAIAASIIEYFLLKNPPESLMLFAQHEN